MKITRIAWHDEEDHGVGAIGIVIVNESSHQIHYPVILRQCPEREKRERDRKRERDNINFGILNVYADTSPIECVWEKIAIMYSEQMQLFLLMGGLIVEN